MTLTAANSNPARNVRSNRAPGMGSSGVTGERPRGTHGSVNRGFGGSADWHLSSIWRDDRHGTVTAMEARSGSSSLLPSSESDAWGRPNVPWSTAGPSASAVSTAHSGGMVTSPGLSRSTDRSAPALSDGNDASTYFTRPVPSSISASAGAGHVTYLDSETEISPSGERSLNSFNVLRNGDWSHSGQPTFTESPVGSGYPARSGFTSPLDNARHDEVAASMGISSLPQTLPDPMSQQISRNVHGHSSHNSVSFAPQRPAHTSHASFHSDSQFGSRHGTGSLDLSDNMTRLQLSDASRGARRPGYVSHASMDAALPQLRHPHASPEANIQAMASYSNEVFSADFQRGYQAGRAGLGEADSISPSADYSLMDGAYHSGRQAGQFYPAGFASNIPEAQPALSGRRLRGGQPQVEYSSHLAPNPLQRLPLQPTYEVPAYQTPSMNIAAYYPSVLQLNTAALVSQNQLPSQAANSPFLQEFKAHSRNRRYELRDIYGHVVEFCGDQHGSRFIQQKLETANSDEKEQVFREVQTNCCQVMLDLFGNYVVQKLFEHCNQSQKRILASYLKGQVVYMSRQMYGCRVVQKALEHILVDQQASLVKEMEGHVLELVECQNGNHVLQKAIERVPSQHVKFIIDEFRGQLRKWAAHTYGCRVVQRMLEHCQPEDRLWMLYELHECTGSLIVDQFGNYVIQHVIEHGAEEDRSEMIEVVMANLLAHSKHKFASNVVEKSIEYGKETQRREIINKLTTPTDTGHSHLLELMSDQYGNYVIQKILCQLKGAERAALVERIKPLLGQLRRYSSGKQITAIEKLIADPSSSSPSRAVSRRNGSSTTPPNSHGSSPQPARRSVSDIESGRPPAVGAAPPTPPPTDNQSTDDTSSDTKSATPTSDTESEAAGTITQGSTSTA